jgi:hypothetical protein
MSARDQGAVVDVVVPVGVSTTFTSTGSLTAAGAGVLKCASTTPVQLKSDNAPDCAALSCADGGGHPGVPLAAAVDVSATNVASASTAVVIATIHIPADRRG